MVLHRTVERNRKEIRYMLYNKCYGEKQRGVRINEVKNKL